MELLPDAEHGVLGDLIDGPAGGAPGLDGGGDVGGDADTELGAHARQVGPPGVPRSRLRGSGTWSSRPRRAGAQNWNAFPEARIAPDQFFRAEPPFEAPREGRLVGGFLFSDWRPTRSLRPA